MNFMVSRIRLLPKSVVESGKYSKY